MKHTLIIICLTVLVSCKKEKIREIEVSGIGYEYNIYSHVSGSASESKIYSPGTKQKFMDDDRNLQLDITSSKPFSQQGNDSFICEIRINGELTYREMRSSHILQF